VDGGGGVVDGGTVVLVVVERRRVETGVLDQIRKGFGFGDIDNYWINSFKLLNIRSINNFWFYSSDDAPL